MLFMALILADNSIKTPSIRAFSFPRTGQPAFNIIRVHRYAINGGLDIPIPPWSSPIVPSSLCFKDVFLANPNASYRVYYAHDSVLLNRNLAVQHILNGVLWCGEVVVVRQSRGEKDTFVNMRRGDNYNARRAIQRFALLCFAR